MAEIKVLLLLHSLEQVGAQRIAVDAFSAPGSQVSLRIVSPHGGPLEEQCRRLGRLYLLDRHEPKRPLARSGEDATLARVSGSVRRWQPHVIYVNSLAALYQARRLHLPSVPVLLHVHEMGMTFDFSSDVIDERISWPSKYIAVSGPVRDLLTERYSIPPERIRVIHNSIPDVDFRRTSPPAPRSGGDFVVGGSGTAHGRKGTSLWLQMAARLKSLLPDRSLRFVWVGVYEDNFETLCLREEARKLGVGDLVEFLPVTRHPLPHYARFDVFAMTSWEDPCPVVVLENMMLGKPVVCFAGGGGAPEEVGETGVVVEDFDPAAMAREIASLASDPGRRLRLGEAARARVGEHFLASHQAPKIHQEIKSLVTGRAYDKT